MKERATRATPGDHLREWRQRRRLSQLDLALDAQISQRHLSFIESGRSVPSRDMLLHLAERLDISLRERNAALLSAGLAPAYPQHRLDAPEMAAARDALKAILTGHEPFPALAVDRHWAMIAANAALAPLLHTVRDKKLLDGPVNVLRLSLHPQGLAPDIVNLDQWRTHLLERLRGQIAATGDEALAELLAELSGYPGENASSARSRVEEHSGVFVPLALRTAAGVLSLISTTTVFGTPRDILLSELAIEAFFPADGETRNILQRINTAG